MASATYRTIQASMFMLLLTSGGAVAQESSTPRESSKPNIIEEKHGNVTNYTVEGSLAATKAVGCIPIAEAKNDLTPADLYQGVLQCINENKFEIATELFALAGIYARFDAERVTDQSAGQAGEVLIMNTFSNLPKSKKSQFMAAFDRVSKSPKSLGSLCADIQKIGAPDYYPKYMILHGMKAFLGDPYEGALSDAFDPAATWRRLQSDYLHCPKKEND
ncbi:hypothetical protein RZS28_13090 [Methylocapsa polymorpha]|uniref:Uncharacterized protein n=1 Tax=Methylocapsa polymorpha TaxID=3080828 RepID=A0ABZ0HQ19_9HYPH|nr:hypothetical protein RZS28_13090 [Methylocapsa sp. RX1]